MDCHQTRLMLSALQDGCVVESERRLLLAHLDECPACSLHQAELDMVQQSLRTVKPRPMPAHLKLSLSSLASREAARRRRVVDFRTWLRHFGEHAALTVNNMMRPIALPAAGGLASAVFLFSMVMTNFQGIIVSHPNDVPIAIATTPSVRATMLDMSDAEITVDVFVDEQGRVIDYSFPDGYGTANTAVVRRKLENSLLFTEFTPATTFGQPTSGWVRVKFSGRSQIDVKG